MSRTLDEIADNCVKEIYYNEDTGEVHAEPAWLNYVAGEIRGALDEAVAEERKALREWASSSLEPELDGLLAWLDAREKGKE